MERCGIHDGIVDTEVLASTPSAILILIRAELWHYAWEKVR